MKIIDCVICGSKSYDALLKVRSCVGGIAEEFTLVRCNHCGLTYLNPMPKEETLRHYYPEKYFETSSLGNASNNVYRLQMAKTLSKFKTVKGRALDVGCGDGSLLLLMKRFGWTVYGVDTSESAVKISRKKLGTENVSAGRLADCRFPSSYFDAVSLRHVLEHLEKPLDTLLEIRRILKKDGVLGISVPNIDSFYFRIFKGAWFHLDIPRHLYQFSPKTLALLLDIAGFKVIKLAASLEDPFEVFRDLLLRFRIKPPVFPRYLLPAILAIVALNLPATMMLSLANRGTSIQIIATPKKST